MLSVTLPLVGRLDISEASFIDCGSCGRGSVVRGVVEVSFYAIYRLGGRGENQLMNPYISLMDR